MSGLFDNYYAGRGGLINPIEVQNVQSTTSATGATGETMLPAAAAGIGLAVGSLGAGLWQGYKQDKLSRAALAYQKEQDAIALKMRKGQIAEEKQRYLRGLMEAAAKQRHWAANYQPTQQGG